MNETKYGRLIVRNPEKIDKFGPEMVYSGERDYVSEKKSSNFSIMFFHISKPVLMEESPHYHDFDMYLYFLGKEKFSDLGAEIVIGIGEEQEMHTITTPASVYIPKGLVHCPLEFKIVRQPLLFVHAVIASKYTKIETH